MSGEQWGEAVDAAAHAIDAACDSANVDGAWRLEDDAEYYDMPGVFAQEAATFARAAIAAAAPLIVADTRRKVAEEIGPYVWIAPGRLGGKPCIGGHRIDVDRVVRHVWVDGVDSVMIPYPDLTRPKILTACWYQATYGGAPWDVRWSAWAHMHGDAMWSGRWDDVPDPNHAIARGSGNGDSGQET